MTTGVDSKSNKGLTKYWIQFTIKDEFASREKVKIIPLITIERQKDCSLNKKNVLRIIIKLMNDNKIEVNLQGIYSKIYTDMPKKLLLLYMNLDYN